MPNASALIPRGWRSTIFTRTKAACQRHLCFSPRLLPGQSESALGTGIVTLPLELPIRVAEDAAVLDLMCGGRLEVGIGPGGNLSGDGLMLSRIQPRPAGRPHLSLPDIQNPMIDAYLGALLPDRAPRILASRSVFVADDRGEALRFAEIGLARQRVRFAAIGRAGFVEGMSVHDQIAAMDIHIGNPDDVIASLRSDSALARATDLTVRSHSIDPPHPFILRSIELVAEVVAPALGWARNDAAAARHHG